VRIKKLTVIRGKGTPHERRIRTSVPLYYSEHLKRWVTIPKERNWE